MSVNKCGICKLKHGKSFSYDFWHSNALKIEKKWNSYNNGDGPKKYTEFIQWCQWRQDNFGDWFKDNHTLQDEQRYIGAIGDPQQYLLYLKKEVDELTDSERLFYYHHLLKVEPQLLPISNGSSGSSEAKQDTSTKTKSKPKPKTIEKPRCSSVSEELNAYPIEKPTFDYTNEAMEVEDMIGLFNHKPYVIGGLQSLSLENQFHLAWFGWIESNKDELMLYENAEEILCNLYRISSSEQTNLIKAMTIKRIISGDDTYKVYQWLKQQLSCGNKNEKAEYEQYSDNDDSDMNDI